VSVQGRPGLPGDHLAQLEAVADVRHVATGGARLTRGEALHHLSGLQIVAITPKVLPEIDDALLDALPDLRAIVLYATGYDMLDVDLLRRRGITLAYLPSYSTISVAEHTLGLMLSISRRVHLGHDRSRGLVPPTTSLRGFELSGRTLGIVGLGRIGSRVADLCHALGMQVIATDIRPVRHPNVDVVDAAELWSRSDVVSLNCSTTLGAPPLVGADELARLPRGAALVNVSRASLVDHSAVVAAIRSGNLRGYAVDDVVFGPDEADLLTEGRLLQTGHTAWWSDETLTRGAHAWLDTILGLLVGAPIPVARSADDLPGGAVPTPAEELVA
jgi:lactate dehydrogenase-like 2-hydroxyacid dehydrogenase